MRKKTYERIICNCGVCGNCQALANRFNAAKSRGLKSFAQFYGENFAIDQIDLLNDSFLDLVDEESDSDYSDDMSLGPILRLLYKIFPHLKFNYNLAMVIAGEVREEEKKGTSLWRAVYKVAKRWLPIYNPLSKKKGKNPENSKDKKLLKKRIDKLDNFDMYGQFDKASNSFNELSDTFDGLLNEEDLLIREFKKYKVDGSLQSVLPKTSVENAPDDVRKAIASGKSRAGIYVFFKNGKRVYVGESQNLPRRLSQHRLCFRKFKINPSAYKVEVYLFKNHSKKPLKKFLKDVEREYRYKYLGKFGHQQNTFDYFL